MRESGSRPGHVAIPRTGNLELGLRRRIRLVELRISSSTKMLKLLTILATFSSASAFLAAPRVASRPAVQVRIIRRHFQPPDAPLPQSA